MVASRLSSAPSAAPEVSVDTAAKSTPSTRNRVHAIDDMARPQMCNEKIEKMSQLEEKTIEALHVNHDELLWNE